MWALGFKPIMEAGEEVRVAFAAAVELGLDHICVTDITSEVKPGLQAVALASNLASAIIASQLLIWPQTKFTEFAPCADD